ncbi:MAG: TlpA family protein disulfide reductase [Flavobacteriaceae bacterium]
MKKILLFITVCLLFSSCEKQNIEQQSEIIITIDDESIQHVEVYRSEKGISLWSNKKDSLIKTKKNQFVLNFSAKELQYARLKVGEKWGIIIIIPGQKYQVHFTKNTKEFSLDNAKGQEVLNSFDRIPAQTFVFLNRFKKDSTAQLVSEKIHAFKNKEFSKIDSLLKENQIDKSFYAFLKKEIDYYYAAATISVSDYKSEQKNASKKAFNDLSIKTINLYPYDKSNLIPPSWSEYTMSSQITRTVINEYSQEVRNKLYKKDSIHFLYTNTIKKKLEEPFRERLIAQYIINSAKQKKYEKSLITIFDDFQKAYPESSFIEYLKDDISTIREYQKKIALELPENVIIIEDKNLNTFEDLLAQLKGQKLYVDMWATWCGPCKVEFGESDKIKTTLKKNGYKKLYISVDRASAYDKWIEMIKYYDLSGYHHLANKTFFKHFSENYTTAQKGSLLLPQYLLIEKDGTITTKNAPRPSQHKKLEKVLDSLSKL